LKKPTFRVLYIEDYALDRILLKDIFRRNAPEIELMEAASREEIEAAIFSGHLDLVISDYNNLGFTGLEVLESIQSHSPSTPVVILSGSEDKNIAENAIKRGAVAFLVKNEHTFQMLPETVRGILEKTKGAQDKE
jgi:DNA-binding NtrC family response regulator